MPAADSTKISYLALGDSYTIGQNVSSTERYPVILSERLKADNISVTNGPTILATTGWTTGQLKSTLSLNTAINSKKYDIVSLLIGVNNQYQGRSLSEYKVEFTELLITSINLANGKKDKVFVISIPDYGYTPYGQSNQASISAQIDLFNAANKHIADSAGVKYFDITPISRNGLSDPALVANDGLHPSGKMYGQWVELMLNDVMEIVKK
ncbi:MAG: SGNH/GDSL hydrolase family protein [Cytophagaceae bacterium]|nr:SGNH/GDSL hydrolase family protein [Cytophagaceae bacterium]